MSDLKVTGIITKVLELEKGTSKAGKDWQKQRFILDTKTEYNNIYCFEIFGEEKTNQFNQFNKVGDTVEVSFNVSTNEWNDKYFTSLSAWRVFKENKKTTKDYAQKEADKVFNDQMVDDLTSEQSDELPF